MRELKYRVWSVDDRTYDDPYSHSYYAMTQDGKLDFYCHGDHWDSCEPDKYIIEQYTGLKDKNGKEICEGDILQIDDHILGDFVVVWHNFGWKIKRSVGYESLSVHKSEDCTVIGNIHENPELLEDENGKN